MEMLDCRRLTGPNCIWARPGAVLDAAVDSDRQDAVVQTWQGHARTLLDAVGWGDEATAVRRVHGGLSLALSAPVDALYAATELAEWAWAATLADFGGTACEALDEAAARIRTVIADESNPPVLELKAAAARHAVAFTSDDDDASVGMGGGSQAWAVDALPAPLEVPWERVHDIPVGMVTGTNGKTTTARLAAGIARAAGRCTGLSSTDGIVVDGQLVEPGDFSGPGGARTVLRDNRVQVAVLETARGGLLRRGLGVERADAAVITNIAADHVGDFGCRDLDELLAVKWAVSHAVAERGCLVLNADDDRLVRRARDWYGRVAWFSMDEGNTRDALQTGADVWTVRGDTLGVVRQGNWHPIRGVADIPVTLDGAARHNIANALAAAALCANMGLSDDAIGHGLGTFQSTDNPGRTDLMNIRGRQVLLDFAHNPAAVDSVLALASRLPARRRLVAFGEAGDRPDSLLRELAGSVWSIAPDRVMISELAAYARGREHGEVARVLRETLESLGARPDQIGYHEHEIDTVTAALDWSEPGDVLVLLILGEQQAVYEHLKALG